MKNLSIEKNHVSSLSIAWQVLKSIKWMHIFCFLFPIIIFSFFLPIIFLVLKSSLQEVKIFSLNIIIIISFLIPFGFLPIAINSFKGNYIYKIKRIPNGKNFKLFSSLVFLFFIYYLVVIILMLIVIAIISSLLKDKNLNITLLEAIFKKSAKYNNSIFGNGINLFNFLISAIVAFFFCAGIGWFFTTFFIKKDYFLIILLFYFISMIISPFLLPIKLSYTNMISKILYYFSIFYYPGNLMLLAWTGKSIFSVTSVLAADTTTFFSSQQIIIFYVISYCGILFYFLVLLLNSYTSNLTNYIINFGSYRKFNNNFFNSIMNYESNVAIVSKSIKELRNLKSFLARSSLGTNRAIFIDFNTENFLPELSFLKNMEIYKSFTNYNYDKNFIAEMITALDLKIDVNKPIYKLSKKNIMLLNFIFALLLNANRIVVVNRFRNINSNDLKEFFKLIHDYTSKYNIKLVILTKDTTNIDIVCEDIVVVKSKKNIEWMKISEWLESKK